MFLNVENVNIFAYKAQCTYSNERGGSWLGGLWVKFLKFDIRGGGGKRRAFVPLRCTLTQTGPAKIVGDKFLENMADDVMVVHTHTQTHTQL